MASSPDGKILDAVRAAVGARSAGAAGGRPPAPLAEPEGWREGGGRAHVRAPRRVPDPFAEPETWWVAFSGGVDSTVLLDAAVRVLGRRSAKRLAAVHVNHGLHPDAGAWEDHCRRAAARLGVRLEVRRPTVAAEVGSGGLEAAARAARHAALAEVVPPGAPVLLAHHRDDQAETALLRILRGAGPAGMAAMRPHVMVGGLRLVRPLLAVTRAEILACARGRGLEWVEDPGNRAPEHDRNHLRHRVLPSIAERWPDAPRTLVRLAERSRETASMLDALAAMDLRAARGTAPDTLNAAAIAALSPPRAANALRAWLVSRHRIPPPPRYWLRLLADEVIAARSDRRPEAVRGSVWVRRFRGELYTGRETGRDRPRPRLPASTPWRLDEGPLDLPHGRLAAVRVEGEGLAVARLPLPVEVRFRRGGERCRPHARGITKSLRDLFQERAVPPWKRWSWPLVFAGDRLAAAPGLFLCDPFAAREAEPAWRLEWRQHPCG